MKRYKIISPSPVPYDPQSPDLRGVTVCITTFLRPKCLSRCLRSLEAVYPQVRRVVVDTGGNLSRGRNQAISKAETPFVMICEDDFMFRKNGYLEQLIHVLYSDPEMAGAAGQTIEPKMDGKRWFANLRRFREHLEFSEPTEARHTPHGLTYFPCDLVLNCGVWRRDVLLQNRFDERLEIAEHLEWFWRFRQQEQWKLCYVPTAFIGHDSARPPAYRKHRKRKRFTTLAKSILQCKHRRFTGWPHAPQQPNVVLLGIGHANTTLTVSQLVALGFNSGVVNKWQEPDLVNSLNSHYLTTRTFAADTARQFLANLPQPWVIKDPRFARGAFTPWLPILAPYRPLLLWVRKDHRQLLESYARRNERITPRELATQERICRHHYATWPWLKLTVEADGMKHAAAFVAR